MLKEWRVVFVFVNDLFKMSYSFFRILFFYLVVALIFCFAVFFFRDIMNVISLENKFKVSYKLYGVINMFVRDRF